MNSESDEEHDAISKQIVDYYKKYSQSRQLPRYFSGTSLTYLPEIVKDEELQTSELPEIKIVSPTSSIASHRKLEWDNGADIGYSNCEKTHKLHKSLSLPTVLSEKKIDDKPQVTTEVVTVISYSSPSEESSSTSKKLPTSSSSPSLAPTAAPSSSTSSSKTESYGSTLAFLKSKIGTPDAESTPKVPSDVYKTCLSHDISNEKPLVTLCKTKAIVINCIDVARTESKDIQTSTIQAISKYVQTDKIDNDSKDTPSPIDNQSVILMNYEEKESGSSNTEPNSDLAASNCDSFEFHKEKPKSVESSSEIPLLSQLISRKQSKTLVGDIDRSIEILQKLLKSKKYDPVTKKRYIKKIIEKILNNKYNEDSTTSTSTSSEVSNAQHKPDLQEKMSKFTIKTFSDAFLPSTEIPKKKSIFTYNNKVEDSASTLDGQLSLDKQNSSSSPSCQSWKKNKTLSEQILEEKQKGQGDQLVNFAMKERQHQLAWISDEIAHLTKLKGLLEQQKIQRTTTVYMLSSQKYDSCSSTDNSRNYVIQTEASSSSDKTNNYNYRMDNRNYRVRQIVGQCEQTNVIGDIEVFSDDNTTKIQVKSGGRTCLTKEPTLIGAPKYNTFPKSRCEQNQSKTNNTRQYSFDLPTLPKVGTPDRTSLVNKVDDIIKRYKTNGDRVSKCLRNCQCCNSYEQKERELCGKIGHVCILGCKCKRATKHCNSDKQCLFGCKCKNHNNNNNQQSTVCDKHIQCAFSCNCQKNNIEEMTKLCDKDTQCVLGCTCHGGKTSEEGASTRRTSKESFGTRDSTGNNSTSTYYSKEPNSKGTSKDTTTAGTTTTKSTKRDCICSNGTVDKTRHEEGPHGNNLQVPQIEGTIYDPSGGVAEATRYDNLINPTQPSRPIETNDVERKADKGIQVEGESFGEESESMTMSNMVQSTSTSDDDDSSTSSEDSSDSSTSTSIDSIQSCLCCKRKHSKTNKLYALRRKLSEQAYPLCRPCYQQHRTGVYSTKFHTNPNHVCNCYTVVETTTLNEIKQTINDINDLDNQYCTCVDVMNNRRKYGYCRYCKCKLKKTSKNKNGIAYMLTFENENINKMKNKKKKKKKHKKPSLEEIKIKIPVYKKKHKDKDNKKKKGKSQVYNLQTYLTKNRPEFVEIAEGRRKLVVDSMNQREQIRDENKLQFLQNCLDCCEKNEKRLFTSKEMKEITKKNYQKLPEVQKRLIDNREKKIRQANRLMADTFNRKLRENVLKGKRSLPTDVAVVKL